MKNIIIASLMAATTFNVQAENGHSSEIVAEDSACMEQLVRIADIEVYPAYSKDFFKAAKKIAETSIREEKGVVCLFPCLLKEDSTCFRVIEIYASPKAYQQHIQTAHFRRYKNETAKMVKSLKLNDVEPVCQSNMAHIFKRLPTHGTNK